MAKRRGNRFSNHKTNSYFGFSRDYPEGDGDSNGRYVKTRRKEKLLRGAGIFASFAFLFVAVYFLATLVLDISSLPIENPADSAPSVSEGEASSSVTEAPEPEQQPLRAVWLTALPFKDEEGAAQFAEKAKANGINGIVFEMKRADGTLAYESSLEIAAEAGAVSRPQKNLTALFSALHENGIKVIAAVNCFNDPLFSAERKEAAVHYSGTDGLWFDNRPDAGGKSWLNPYSEEAAEYLYSVMEEISAMSVDEIMLAGVQFPSGYALELATFEGEDAGLTRNQALLSFIGGASERLAGKAGLVISMTGDGAISGNEQLYDGSLLDGSVGKAAPDMRISRMANVKIGDKTYYNPSDKAEEFMNAAAEKLAKRSQVGNRKIDLSPIVEYPYAENSGNTADILAKNGIEGYILYNPQNSYGF